MLIRPVRNRQARAAVRSVGAAGAAIRSRLAVAQGASGAFAGNPKLRARADAARRPLSEAATRSVPRKPKSSMRTSAEPIVPAAAPSTFATERYLKDTFAHSP